MKALSFLVVPISGVALGLVQGEGLISVFRSARSFVFLVVGAIISVFAFAPIAGAQETTPDKYFRGEVVLQVRNRLATVTQFKIQVSASTTDTPTDPPGGRILTRTSKVFRLIDGNDGNFKFTFPVARFAGAVQGVLGLDVAIVVWRRIALPAPSHGFMWVREQFSGMTLVHDSLTSKVLLSVDAIPPILTIATGSDTPATQMVGRGDQEVRLLDVDVKANAAHDLFEYTLVVDVAIKNGNGRLGSFGFTGFRLKNGRGHAWLEDQSARVALIPGQSTSLTFTSDKGDSVFDDMELTINMNGPTEEK